jgi:thiamine biosynthesis lipoprotein
VTRSARHLVEPVMGTVVSLRLRDPAPTALLDRVAAWLHRVDQVFSTYRADSQISRLASGATTLDRCDPDVRLVLELCERLREASGGYFDAWAAGPGLLDPSGVVKGWSVEVASDLLVAEGFGDHLINAGGDVQARGEREPGRPWRVGVSDPRQPDRLLAVVDARDLAVATSGTAERGAHVFDPHRRVAVDELAGVTVVGPSLTWADGYATAALAMGLAAPDWLTGLDGHQALVVDADGEAWWTPGFPMPGADARGATATGSRAPERPARVTWTAWRGRRGTGR